MTQVEPAQRYAAPIIVWFRDDLRLADNPALFHAAATGKRIVCLYVRDETSAGIRPPGSAARWWLAASLRELERDIAGHGGRLILRHGRSFDILPALAAEVGAAGVFWNRRYDAASVHLDLTIEKELASRGVAVKTFQASLLFEPAAVQTLTGKPHTLFQSYWWQAGQLAKPRLPLPPLKRIDAPDNAGAIASDRLDDWKLEPPADGAQGLHAAWTPGEASARKRLYEFMASGLAGYGKQRDRPDLALTSMLSPHLRFGEISPFEIWHAAQMSAEPPRVGGPTAADLDKFQAELGWREFSYHILFHHPEILTQNYQKRFDRFPWGAGGESLKSWQQGRTGYPIIDAGMRQLLQTGWMNYRVRTIVASFLVKDLMLDWRTGEAWFWDTLVDADPANNPVSWQRVSGSGADAEPFLRVCNPVMQAETFDPKGDYVRKWVPELANMPKEFIHEPWRAPYFTLTAAGVRLGETYPRPAVDHRRARERALAAYAALKPAVA